MKTDWRLIKDSHDWETWKRMRKLSSWNGKLIVQWKTVLVANGKENQATVIFRCTEESIECDNSY